MGTNNETLSLLLIERYAKGLHRLQDLMNISYKSSFDTIFAGIAECREMVAQARQMKRDFDKALTEYKGSSGPAYRDWFIKFCGKDWPLYFDISAREEEIKLTAIPRPLRSEYASNLSSIGGTLDEITRSLALAFGFENTHFEMELKKYFTPSARGTNDGKYNRLIIPEFQALKDDGLTLKEWGAVACMLQNSSAATRELRDKSFDAWCREFLGIMGVPFGERSVPRWGESQSQAENNSRLQRLMKALEGVADS